MKWTFIAGVCTFGGENRVWELKKNDVPGRSGYDLRTGLVNGRGPRNYQLGCRKGQSFGGKWGYIPITRRDDPILDPETQQEFAKMHKSCEEPDVAFAFVVEEWRP